MRGLAEFVKFRVVNNDIFLNDINLPSFPLRDALRGVMQRVKRTSTTHPSVTLVAFREILESHYDVCASFMLVTFQASSCARECEIIMTFLFLRSFRSSLARLRTPAAWFSYPFIMGIFEIFFLLLPKYYESNTFTK